jgi:hypothetical protein
MGGDDLTGQGRAGIRCGGAEVRQLEFVCRQRSRVAAAVRMMDEDVHEIASLVMVGRRIRRVSVGLHVSGMNEDRFRMLDEFVYLTERAKPGLPHQAQRNRQQDQQSGDERRTTLWGEWNHRGLG